METLSQIREKRTGIAVDLTPEARARAKTALHRLAVLGKNAEPNEEQYNALFDLTQLVASHVRAGAYRTCAEAVDHVFRDTPEVPHGARVRASTIVMMMVLAYAVGELRAVVNEIVDFEKDEEEFATVVDVFFATVVDVFTDARSFAVSADPAKCQAEK